MVHEIEWAIQVLNLFVLTYMQIIHEFKPIVRNLQTQIMTRSSSSKWSQRIQVTSWPLKFNHAIKSYRRRNLHFKDFLEKGFAVQVACEGIMHLQLKINFINKNPVAFQKKKLGNKEALFSLQQTRQSYKAASTLEITYLRE